MVPSTKKPSPFEVYSSCLKRGEELEVDLILDMARYKEQKGLPQNGEPDAPFLYLDWAFPYLEISLFVLAENGRCSGAFLDPLLSAQARATHLTSSKKWLTKT